MAEKLRDFIKQLSNKRFQTVWFDGNQWFGYIDSPKKAKEILEHYSYKEIRRAKIYSGDFKIGSDPLRFGFYREYQGSSTFGDWIDWNEQNEYYEPTIINKFLTWFDSKFK